MKGSGRHANAAMDPDAPDEDDEDDDDQDSGDSGDEEVLFGHGIEGGDADEMGDSALSLFGPERFPSAAAFWSHAEAEYSFSLAKLKNEVGTENWTDYHRMRLVNYLRKMGPTAAKSEICKINQSSEFWSNDDFLQPVLGDDVLLFEDDEDDWDDFRADAGKSGCPSGFSAEIGSANVDKDEEIARLRSELASARRLLSAFGGGEDDSGYSSNRLPPSVSAQPSSGSLNRSRSRVPSIPGSVSKRFYEFCKQHPNLLNDKVVLNIDCAAGALSCLCASLGTCRVLASETSFEGQQLSRKVIEANNLDKQVEIISIEGGELPAEILSSGGKGHGICDLLFSERLLSELRLSPSLFSLVSMRRFLRPGGRVLPGRLRVLAFAVGSDSSDTFSSCGIDLIMLDVLPRVEVVSALQTFITSRDPATILEVDLTTADIEGLLSSQSFKLNLNPGSCTSAIAICIEAGMDDAFDLRPAEHECALTVFHLSQPGSAPSRPLKLLGDEFNALEGTVMVRRVGEGQSLSLQVRMELSASPKTPATGSELQVSNTFIVDS